MGKIRKRETIRTDPEDRTAREVGVVSAVDLDIRDLTSTSDSVEVKQTTAANLCATVTQAGSVTVVQSVAANLKATVTQLAKDRTVTCDTASNLKVEPTQTTASNLKVTTVAEDRVYDHAHFDGSSSGNLVDAVTDKVIKVHGLTIQAAGTVVVNLNSGSGGTSLAEWTFQAREGVVYSFAPYPAHWMQTGTSAALYVTLSAAVVVTVNCIYTDDDAS